MTTIIVSNGSKWAGQDPDSIETLLQVLEECPLDRTFEQFGNFYTPEPRLCDQWGNHNHDSEYEGKASFFGNFYGTSHVFNIYTDDRAILVPLLEAIDRNQHRPDYLSQPKPRDDSHPYNEHCSCMTCRYESHRKTCPTCQAKKNA